MGKNDIFYFMVIIGVSLSFLIMLSENVSSVSPAAPYIRINCDINVTYFQENLCEDDNCSPKVTMNWDAYNNYGIYRFSIDGISIQPSDGFIHLHHDPYSSQKIYNFSDDALEYLDRACNPDITPVIDYMEENNLTEDYNEFYPHYPTGYNVDKHKVTQIDDTWYLESYSFDPESVESWYQFTFLMCVVAPILIIVTISLLIGFLLYKRWKKRNK